MNNDEMKKKIVDILIKTDENIQNEIIKATEEHKVFLTEDNQYYYIVADALIEAGIGDVKDAEHRTERAERALDLLAEYAHEFYTKTRFVGDYFVNDPKAIRRKFLKQAEKELEEEENG